MIQLSKRLKTIHDLTPNGVAIDVGADHGQLIISLVLDDIVHHGYAVENKKGPYERMVKAINASKVKDKITPIFSSGIKDMPKDVKTVIIAGMGGQTIVNILKDDQEKLLDVTNLLIDSHGAFSFVREEISNLGFYIKNEQMVYEDEIFYEIMLYERGHEEYNQDDYMFGPILRRRKDDLYVKRWQKRLLEIDNLLSQERIPNQRKNELEAEKERIMANL